MRAALLTALALACTAAYPAAAQEAAQRIVDPVAPPGEMTAKVDLGAEYPQMKGYTFTQSYTTVAPGTGRPMHSHTRFPEIVRILSGTLTDARNGEPPKQYGPGSTLINAAGTRHMWANLGAEPVVFVATAIRAPQ